MLIDDFRSFIYESSISEEDKELLINALEYVSDSDLDYFIEYATGLTYVMEKKSRSDYRIQKFKKKYGYDSKTGTILSDPNDANSKRVKINILDASKARNYKGQIESDEKTSANRLNSEITVTRKNFNMKHPKAHEFIVNHELGHLARNTDKNYRKKDNEIENTPTYQRAIKDYAKTTSRGKPAYVIPDHSMSHEERYADKYAVDHTKNGLKVLKSVTKEFNRQTNKTPDEEYTKAYLRAKKNADKDLKSAKKSLDNLPLMDRLNPKIMSDRLSDIQDLKDARDDVADEYDYVKAHQKANGKYERRGSRYDASMRYGVQKDLHNKNKKMIV